MARRKRLVVEYGTYHITCRGNNRNDIFVDDTDRNQYLSYLKKYAVRYQMQIYGYCLMSNHVHLIVKDSGFNLSRFMHGLNCSYVQYYHRKNGGSGAFFEGRFRSSLITDNNYFMRALNYVHRNPKKAGIVKKPSDYEWSSQIAYDQGMDAKNIVDITYLYTMLGGHLYDLSDIAETCAKINNLEEDEDIDKILTNGANVANKVDATQENELKNETEVTEMTASVSSTNKESVKGVTKYFDDGEFLSEYGITALPFVNERQIVDVLVLEWDPEFRELIFENNQPNEQKAIYAYLVSILSRKTYTEVADIMHMDVNIIYKMLQRLVERLETNCDRQFDDMIDILGIFWRRFKKRDDDNTEEK